VKPIQEAAIQQYAKQLRLPTLGGQFARLAGEAVKEKQSHLSYLEALLEGEVEERERKAMARRIQEARFPSVKTLEEFDFPIAPHISAALLRNLSEGGYLARKEPIIFLGETGTGKTHLATGLAVAACRQAGAVHDGGGNGDGVDRSPEPGRTDARTESLDPLRPDRD
jgi:DNA replication protein DnaC